MKIGILTTASYFSQLLISDLVERRASDIACIVVTPSIVRGKTLWQSVRHVYAKTGPANLVYKVVAGLWVYFAEVLHKLRVIRHCITPSNLAKRHNIPLFYSQDCNNSRTLDFLQTADIDIILSINVYQRMQAPLLNLPKLAAINNHFGMLPHYRGMAPYIWAMAKGEEQIGLTVHHMVLQFDEGRIICQETMPIKNGATAMGVYLRGCMIARRMILDAVNMVEQDPGVGIEQQGDGSYFSMPTRACIKALHDNGYSLWSLRDLWCVLRGPDDAEGSGIYP